MVNATADTCTSPSDLVEVLVFSMVDMSRAKASTTRLLELPRSSFAVVSSYSSGSTPDRDRKQTGFYCGIKGKCGQLLAVKPPAVFVCHLWQRFRDKPRQSESEVDQTTVTHT